ncbi:MAG TPA: TraB/GumN family protein [Thermoplasmata archaeon]|nr:TraB/GumN family protein [Thermoplasmata archaeon]
MQWTTASTAEAPVLLVGVAHVVDLAEPIRRTLDGRVLDGIALELDPERASVLLGPEGGSAHRPRGVPLMARLWAHLQRRLGAELGGGAAGEEMKVAARCANDRQLPLFLIDDPIRMTLTRLLNALPLRERVNLLVGALVGLFVPARVVEREMDRYVAQPDEFAAELREASPTLARVLLDDRNEHMAGRLAALRSRGYGRVAAVVGDAHLPGLAAALRHRGVPVETVTLRDLRGITAPSSSPS